MSSATVVITAAKPEQEQLGVAPVGQGRHDGDRSLRLGAS